jgi:hypothetical protein
MPVTASRAHGVSVRAVHSIVVSIVANAGVTAVITEEVTGEVTEEVTEDCGRDSAALCYQRVGFIRK